MNCTPNYSLDGDYLILRMRETNFFLAKEYFSIYLSAENKSDKEN